MKAAGPLPLKIENESLPGEIRVDAGRLRAYRWLIHSMVRGRANESRFHVRGYNDEGTTTTPFDMVVLNSISRFHLAIDAPKHVPRLGSEALDAIDMFNRKLYGHHAYIRLHFQDWPEIRNWHWAQSSERILKRVRPSDLELHCVRRRLFPPST
jgi:hypothetical protein